MAAGAYACTERIPYAPNADGFGPPGRWRLALPSWVWPHKESITTAEMAAAGYPEAQEKAGRELAGANAAGQCLSTRLPCPCAPLLLLLLLLSTCPLKVSLVPPLLCAAQWGGVVVDVPQQPGEVKVSWLQCTQPAIVAHLEEQYAPVVAEAARACAAALAQEADDTGFGQHVMVSSRFAGEQGSLHSAGDPACIALSCCPVHASVTSRQPLSVSNACLLQTKGWHVMVVPVSERCLVGASLPCGVVLLSTHALFSCLASAHPGEALLYLIAHQMAPWYCRHKVCRVVEQAVVNVAGCKCLQLDCMLAHVRDSRRSPSPLLHVACSGSKRSALCFRALGPIMPTPAKWSSTLTYQSMTAAEKHCVRLRWRLATSSKACSCELGGRQHSTWCCNALAPY